MLSCYTLLYYQLPMSLSSRESICVSDCMYIRTVVFYTGALTENYYTDIVKCLNKASQQCVPSIKTDFQKEWWRPELDE